MDVHEAHQALLAEALERLHLVLLREPRQQHQVLLADFGGECAGVEVLQHDEEHAVGHLPDHHGAGMGFLHAAVEHRPEDPASGRQDVPMPVNQARPLLSLSLSLSVAFFVHVFLPSFVHFKDDV